MRRFGTPEPVDADRLYFFSPEVQLRFHAVCKPFGALPLALLGFFIYL